MPEPLVWPIRVKDESASGFQSYLRNLRATQKEQALSGERAFQTSLKAGPEGLLKLAGIGLGATIIQSVVGQLKAATSSLKDNVTGLRTGTTKLGDVIESTASSLPFGIGDGWDLGRNIREIFTGDDAKAQIEETRNGLKNTIQQSRNQAVRALTADHRNIIQKIYQTSASIQSGGLQSTSASIQGEQFSSDSDIRSGKEDINKLFSAREDAAGKLRTEAQNRLVALNSFGNQAFSFGTGGELGNVSGIAEARLQKEESERELASIAREKFMAKSTLVSDREKLLHGRVDLINQNAELSGLGLLGGIGGRLSALNNGGSPESRSLAYQIQTQLQGDDLRRQLTALGPAGAAGLPILDKYLAIANSPGQVALAGGGLGPLSLPSESSLPGGTRGFAANAYAQGEINRTAAFNDNGAKISDLLQQILTAVGGHAIPQNWNGAHN